VTLTPLPTPVTVQVSQGNNPPGNSSQLPGAAGILVQQIVLTNPGTNVVTLTNLTLTQAGGAGITSATLLKNGSPITSVAIVGGSAVFNITDTIQPNNGAVTYQVQVDLSNTAAGTYSFSITSEAGTNGQAVLFNPSTAPGATVTVSSATFTPIFTPTTTVTTTLTATRTPVPNTTPVIYPNPSSGGPVNILPAFFTGTQDITVQVFTTAFRMVQEQTYHNRAYGPITITMTDMKGNPLASGLYYVVLSTPQGSRSVSKLLLLR
jgi:hypothetical protein